MQWPRMTDQSALGSFVVLLSLALIGCLTWIAIRSTQDTDLSGNAGTGASTKQTGIIPSKISLIDSITLDHIPGLVRPGGGRFRTITVSKDGVVTDVVGSGGGFMPFGRLEHHGDGQYRPEETFRGVITAQDFRRLEALFDRYPSWDKNYENIMVTDCSSDEIAVSMGGHRKSVRVEYTGFERPPSGFKEIVLAIKNMLPQVIDWKKIE